MIIFLFTLVAAAAALAGGYTAIRTKKRLHLAMALTSGLVLGLVGFDLLPEIFEGALRTRTDTVWPMLFFVTGFLCFILSRRPYWFMERMNQAMNSTPTQNLVWHEQLHWPLIVSLMD